jgi:hypothetical protein
MIHEIIQQPRTTNVRAVTLLESCNDTLMVILASEIAQQRLAGIPTHHLEQQLEKEMTRSFAATRTLNGRPTSLVVNRPYYRNQNK